MPVSGIDHVNILTDDLEATASFYERLLGLTRSENPAIRSGIAGYWLRDAEGMPIIHLVDRLSASERYEGYRPGSSTNALHHVALRCDDFVEMKARVEAMGLEHRVNDLSRMGVMQIFLSDPNAVNLELNFHKVSA
ncbi:VOC family protein [Novosphingobium soli]|uniref:VOC family protein n=1 Tax=Novosphingobium soli TaxID=574956 RepID=A0ABV6CV24_9SPHN